jgi:hypothetical protein
MQLGPNIGLLGAAASSRKTICLVSATPLPRGINQSSVAGKHGTAACRGTNHQTHRKPETNIA